MTTYNHSSSYNRTYERKVIEETPRVRLGSPSLVFPSAIPTSTIPASSSFHASNYGFGGGVGSVHSTDESFHATLDVSQFRPEDLKVSVIGSFIVVEGRHPEKSDELGLIERFFVRKFALPRGVQPEAVTSSLSSDGALSIQALPPPKRVCPLLSPHSPQENSPARTIPIKIVQTPSAQASPQPSAVPTSTTNGAEAPKP